MLKNPLKINLKTELFSIFFIVLGFIMAIFFLKNFPDQVAVHWNISGEPDRFSNKYLAAITIPLITVLMYLLFIFLPTIDPKRERYAEFSKVYNYFRSVIIFFMIFIFIISGFNNLGYNLPVDKIVPVAVGLLFVFIGVYIKKIKMNWFIGIKTPWTLSSENVWDKTHNFSGKIFMIAGVLLIISSFLENSFKLILFITALSLIVFSVTIYSYYVYAKEFKKRESKNNRNN